MASPDSTVLVEAYRHIAALMRSRPDRDIHEVRALYEQLHRVTGEPEGVCYQEVCADGIPALWCHPRGADAGHAILYVHGGGFQLGSIALYRKLVGHLAAAGGVSALVFEYCLAPEHPYPAQLSDAASMQRWLASHGVSPDRTVIVGDSAGANLSAAHVLRFVGQGGLTPAGIVAMSPWYDLTVSNPSIAMRKAVDIAVSRSGLLAMRSAYLADGPSPDEPCVSPVYADLTDLPPVLLITGDHEILLDDTLVFAKNARAVGVSVEVDIFHGMPHVFPLLAGRAPEADQAVARAGRWARAQLGLPALSNRQVRDADRAG